MLARLSRGCIGWAIAATGDDTLYASVHQRVEQIVDAIEAGWRSGSPTPVSSRDASTATAARGVRSSSCGSGGCGTSCSCSKGHGGYHHLSWREMLERQAAALRPADVVRWTHNVTRTIDALERNANVRLALDVFMLEAPTLATRA